MKKFVAILMVSLMLLSLASCGGKFTCDSCMQEKSGKKYDGELLGEKIVVCEDCYKLAEQLAEGLQNLEGLGI